MHIIAAYYCPRCQLHARVYLFCVCVYRTSQILMGYIQDWVERQEANACIFN